MRLLLSCAVCLLVLIAPAVALADWTENFDSYGLGTPLHGQGGWEGWNGSPAATGYVTDAYARSAPYSAEIINTSDCVQQFMGVNSGRWIFTAYCYIPSGGTGDTYCILLNSYPTVENNDWSAQIMFSQTTGVVSDADNPTGPTIPIVYGQWVEVRDEIDFDADQQSIYYNNVLLNTKSWTGGTSPGGSLQLNALDLFSNNASTIYWDDLSVLPYEPPTPVLETSWGRIKSSFGR